MHRSIAITFASLFCASMPLHADPIPTRDQNPLLAGFGLPVARPAAIGGAPEWSLAADLNWSSTALVHVDRGELLIVDAEVKELRVSAQFSLGERFAFRMQLPYRTLSGGTLDGFIDDWHGFFGLSEGARPVQPEDRLWIEYAQSGAPPLYFGAAESGVGDLAAELGYSLHAGDVAAASLWLHVELPTGEAEKLNGNEAVDVSMILAGERRLTDRWSLYGQAAATWLGEGELIPERQNDVVWSAVAGVSWRALRPLVFKAQLDAHTAAYDSELDFLSEAAILTIGGELRFASGWRIDVGVSEDIAVERAPDVVFVLGVARRVDQ